VAKEYGLDSPSHVVVERIPCRILIRKLEVRIRIRGEKKRNGI
jgi:hypothetical protein